MAKGHKKSDLWIFRVSPYAVDLWQKKLWILLQICTESAAFAPAIQKGVKIRNRNWHVVDFNICSAGKDCSMWMRLNKFAANLKVKSAAFPSALDWPLTSDINLVTRWSFASELLHILTVLTLLIQPVFFSQTPETAVNGSLGQYLLIHYTPGPRGQRFVLYMAFRVILVVTCNPVLNG